MEPLNSENFLQTRPSFISGAVILLGKTNMFRFNHPAEAAKMRQDFKGMRYKITIYLFNIYERRLQLTV